MLLRVGWCVDKSIRDDFSCRPTCIVYAGDRLTFRARALVEPGAVKQGNCPLDEIPMRQVVFTVLLLGALSRSAQAAEEPASSSRIPSEPLHEQVLRLPGDPDRPADLVVTLYVPDGRGPFPLAIMNHGSSGDDAKRAGEQRYRYTIAAYYFLSRGYAVALPMMRGFAGSDGAMERVGCDLDRIARDDGRDIEAVIADLAANPRLDTRRVVVAGQSFGGWNTLGVGALRPRDVAALVNFNGGLRSSDCPDGAPSLVSGARRLGARTRVPSLWFYGENDSLFPTATWKAMLEAYTGAGADARLVDVGRFMDDSHQLLSHPESIRLWVPALDAFLTTNGLLGRAVLPRYMPAPWPPPTHYAAVDDAAAVPWIGSAKQSAYAKFLTLRFPRVFLITPSGQFAMGSGGLDPLGRAMAACHKAGLDCFPYAIDHDVVFVPPPVAGRPRATQFAALGDVMAVPWIGEKGRDAYRHFLSHRVPRVFVLGLDGQFIAAFGPDGLSRAMAICRDAHIDCRPYAMDDDVVWVPPPPPWRPTATGFADLTSVEAVPQVDARGKALYARFLEMPPPRAFVIASSGKVVAARGGYDPLGRALRRCRDLGLTCRPYAVDNAVVWSSSGE